MSKKLQLTQDEVIYMSGTPSVTKYPLPFETYKLLLSKIAKLENYDERNTLVGILHDLKFHTPS